MATTWQPVAARVIEVMARYLYRCSEHGAVEISHAMSEAGNPQKCPECGGAVIRILTPLHHRWISGDRPGYEHSGNRMFLDPNRLARDRDKLSEMKEEHENREGKR